MKNADMPAFSAPNIIASGSHNTINAPQGTGLTKRELFAAMAMQGILSVGEQWHPGLAYDAAARAVNYADALLAALSGEPKP